MAFLCIEAFQSRDVTTHIFVDGEDVPHMGDMTVIHLFALYSLLYLLWPLCASYSLAQVWSKERFRNAETHLMMSLGLRLCFSPGKACAHVPCITL